MKKGIQCLLMTATLLLLSTGLADAGGCSGAIWALHSDLNKDNSDNPFYPNEPVYLGGHKFDVPSGLYNYQILDTSEGQKKVYEGYVWIKDDGTIDLYDKDHQPIWTIPDNPKESYRVDLYLGSCNQGDDIKTHKKSDTFYTVPEFSTIAIPVAIALIAGLFLFRRQ